ncbi:Omega-6 fatty acid desaturase, chloroplastic, partial [Sesamum angolense]
MACRATHSSFLFLGPQKRPTKGDRIFPQSSASSGAYVLKWEGLPQRRSKQNQSLISFRKHKVVKAVAVSVAPPPADSVEHRQQLCQEYGFRQIGEPLPDNVTLRDIIDTLPKKHGLGLELQLRG